ncbi:MAG: D-alanine--D-alanine ligase [Acidobacteria bacterium]|nr:D-alanine--D-alanine ligase [Acidobacteriota bacterium]
MKRTRVGVIFGGRSSEHDVSVRSASSVLGNLDPERYNPVAIYIDPQGRWILPSRSPEAATDAEAREYVRDQARSFRHRTEVVLPARPDEDATLLLFTRETEGESAESDPGHNASTVRQLHLDVVFPVLHGPYGEDGTIQGLFEMANVPYVGAGVLGSAVGMDKAIMKVLFRAHGLPVAPFTVVSARDWARDRSGVAAQIAARFGFPVFVKPANLGSSVGISKAKDASELATAIDLAAQYDRKIVVEAAVPNVREIEVSVLGNDLPEASLPGEVVPSSDCEFYDYDAKYKKDSDLLIPASLTPEQTAEARRLAVAAFVAIDGSGMGRVDFLFDHVADAWYVSEINTIPGFTTISMYPKLWAATGLGYAALLDRLIELAIERHTAKQVLRTSTA